MFDIIKCIPFYIIPVIFSVFIIISYFRIFFSIQRNICSWIIRIIFIVWQFYLENFSILPSYLNVLVNILLIWLICIMGYEGDILQKTVFSFLLIAMWMLMEFLVGYFFSLSGLHYDNLTFCGSVFSKILILLLTFALKKYFENEHVVNLSINHNLQLMLISVGGMYLLYNIFMLTAINNMQLSYILRGLLSLVIVLGINLITYKLYLNLSKEKEIQRCNTVYEQQLELYSQYMKEKESLLEDFRNERHDIKQHYSVLNSMLSSGVVDEALEYISKLIEDSTINRMSVCRTDNIVVDSIVNFKYSIASIKNVKLFTQIYIPVQLPFKNADMGILIGNILDNAIECTSLLPVEKRRIDFYMKFEKNILIITEKNEYDGIILRSKSGKLLTKKDDISNHGIGLLSVRKIADKYHGAVVIDTSYNVYKIKVTLCS